MDSFTERRELSFLQNYYNIYPIVLHGLFSYDPEGILEEKKEGVR